jgi:hypothetical protein
MSNRERAGQAKLQVCLENDDRRNKDAQKRTEWHQDERISSNRTKLEDAIMAKRIAMIVHGGAWVRDELH